MTVAVAGETNLWIFIYSEALINLRVAVVCWFRFGCSLTMTNCVWNFFQSCHTLTTFTGQR